MPRANRHFRPDTVYHVTARGVDRRMIFLTDDDRRCFLGLLNSSLRDSRCSLVADCLMGNHFHLLMAVSDIAIGVPLHKMLTAYAVRFNAINRRSGHLFQARFHANPVHEIGYLQNAIAYVHANPVRAGLTRSVGDWRWSTHDAWMRLDRSMVDFDRLERLMDVKARELRDSYIRRLKELAVPRPKGMTLNDLVLDTARMLGLNPQDLIAGRRGTLYSKARALLAARAEEAGYSMSQLAAALNCTPAAFTMARKRRAAETCPPR